jgi:hypothetical protein
LLSFSCWSGGYTLPCRGDQPRFLRSLLRTLLNSYFLILPSSFFLLTFFGRAQRTAIAPQVGQFVFRARALNPHYQPSTLTSILPSPIMNPDPVVAYTSRGRRPAYAAILLGAGPNTIPHHYHPDHANRVLHSHHDPKLLRAERLPSASAAMRHAVLPASDTGWPGDKPCRPPGWRPTAVTLPSVQSDVMMIPAGREKCRRRSETLRQLKPKHIAIKSKRPLQVRHFQMHVTHPDVRMNCLRVHAVMSRYKRCLGKSTANTMAIWTIGSVIASHRWSLITCDLSLLRGV